MKNTLYALLSLMVITAIIFITVLVRQYEIRSAVLEQEKEVQILSVVQLGRWGEWFQEYSLIVEEDGRRYRIWTDGDGKIVDSEVFGSDSGNNEGGP
ncbi:hypothetical protein [Jeotgalibacillus sp. JSM ZJ347]|uniref:hypothetical protein n=1 Tax=Jeotgalibacillus sp. JSM ZJ347 TaxID=3342117 RepID=UPI0035A9716D